VGIAGLCRQNSEPLGFGESLLTFVKCIKHIRLQNKHTRHVEKIERPRAKFCAITSGKELRLLPNLRGERLGAKDPGGLMLQKKLVDRSCLPLPPLLTEYSQFKSVGELCFA